MWKGEWLASRPADFKAENKHYGYFEHADLKLMKEKNKTWLSLVDFYDHHQGAEPLYTEWKKLSATPGFTDPEIVSNISNVYLRPTAYSQI